MFLISKNADLRSIRIGGIITLFIEYQLSAQEEQMSIAMRERPRAWVFS